MSAILCKEVLAPSEPVPANSYVEMPCSSMVRDTLSGPFDSAPMGVREEDIFVALRSG